MSFAMQVSKFRDKAKENVDRVYRASIRDVMAQATVEQPGVKKTGGTFEVGKLPVDTGRLAESLYLSINGNMRMGVRDTFRREVDKVKAGDTVRFGWNAPYAAKMEFGEGQVAGRFFATKAVNRWRSFVNANAARFSK